MIDVTDTTPAPHMVSPVTDKANMLIDKMHHVISNPTTPAHQEIIDASFGRTDFYNREAIKKTIEDMKGANVRLRTTPTGDTTHTRICPIEVQSSNGDFNLYQADSVAFSNAMHNAPNDEKARVLLHHTATYAAHANTNAMRVQVGSTSKFVIPSLRSNPDIENRIEYRGPIPTTPTEVNGNRDWQYVKRKTVNMEKSADAYRIFGCLSDHAIPNETILNNRRQSAQSMSLVPSHQ
jgi:hypothetical protein